MEAVALRNGSPLCTQPPNGKSDNDIVQYAASI